MFACGFAIYVWVNPEYDLPDEHVLASANGLPINVRQDPDDSGSVVFNLTGDHRLYKYSHACGEADVVAARLAHAVGPIALGYNPALHVTKPPHSNYYDVFQITAPGFSRTYQECERTWTKGNRFLGIMAASVALLSALFWLRQFNARRR